MKRSIRLRGINGDVDGKYWESESILRAGRLTTLEVVLDDSSVSRRHAEIRSTDNGWRVRDLGSTNGTFLNGSRLGPGEWAVRSHDIIKFGNVALVVDTLRDVAAETNDDSTVCPVENMHVAAVGNQSWEQAFNFAFEGEREQGPCARQVTLATVLRAGHHLGHVESEEELLHTILRDAVNTLKAQRGAIALSDGTRFSTAATRITGNNQIASRTAFSQSLAPSLLHAGAIDSLLQRR